MATKEFYEALKIGHAVLYLGAVWTATRKEMPADMDARAFIRLERINPQGSHEQVNVERESWVLLTNTHSSNAISQQLCPPS